MLSAFFGWNRCRNHELGSCGVLGQTSLVWRREFRRQGRVHAVVRCDRPAGPGAAAHPSRGRHRARPSRTSPAAGRSGNPLMAQTGTAGHTTPRDWLRRTSDRPPRLSTRPPRRPQADKTPGSLTPRLWAVSPCKLAGHARCDGGTNSIPGLEVPPSVAQPTCSGPTPGFRPSGTSSRTATVLTR